MDRIGEKIRKLRESRHWTQTQLAQKLDISSHSYISELESGKKRPTTEMALKLASLFNVSTDLLLRDDLDLDPL